MARERWEDVVAYYRTYLSLVQSLIKEVKTIILHISPSDLLNQGTIIAEFEAASKRKVSKVKTIAEFNAYFLNEIFHHILNYIDEIKNDFEPIDIKDYIIDFLEESDITFDKLLNLVEEDPNMQQKSLLYKLFHPLANLLFPAGNTLDEIYSTLIDQSPEWYLAQRYILHPTTFYREKIDEMTIPGLSPKIFQIINHITSLFNLDPNYLDSEENSDYVIPTIMISDVFEPFIDNIATSEEEAIKRICNRMELHVIMNTFIGPNLNFLDLVEPHKYITQQIDADGKIRWIPQFSNETLILLYLAKISFRRGFLSKELINWIAMNFAFIIYNAILHTFLSDDNIFYNLFLDLKTEEKILPYLMKLLCFEEYLRLDRTKIRDSPVYRKEIFTFLGKKIEAIDRLTFHLVDIVRKELDYEEFEI
ncbi:MAG: hypothetical protein ACTSWC_01350 [Promethearchaeota archaeon]